MPSNISLIIGNCISLIAAIFTAKSAYDKDRWNIYIDQVIQCALLAIASIFFNSYAGIVTLVICAVRNLLLAYDKFGKKSLIVSLILLLALGFYLNNRGYIGIIVIMANVIYTLGCYLAKRELTMKINIALDMIMWMIYEVLIIDIPSLVADSVTLVLAIIAIYKCVKKAEF